MTNFGMPAPERASEFVYGPFLGATGFASALTTQVLHPIASSIRQHNDGELQANKDLTRFETFMVTLAKHWQSQWHPKSKMSDLYAALAAGEFCTAF
jgi:hypothetical protein